jgi:hypothetical protein
MPVLADLRRHGVDHRLADAVELGLVDEPFARVRLRVGVVADHVDALPSAFFSTGAMATGSLAANRMPLTPCVM